MRRSIALALAAASLLALSAAAQEDPIEGAVEGVEVFDPEYFAVYNPVTANDMVRQVPGFSVSGGRGGPQRRGFEGNASNVLVNGERPSSKEPIFATLNRIAARNVMRIELIRGGAGAASSDVRGQSEIVNVVLRPGAENTTTTTYQINLNYQPDGRAWWFLRGAQSFRAYGADALFEVTLPSNQNREERFEQILLANGDLDQTRDEYSQNNFREIGLNAALGWEPTDRDSINLNANLNPRFARRRSGSLFFDPSGALDGGERSEGQDQGSYSTEVGADWERQLTDGLSFKLVGLASFSNSENTSEFEEFDASGVTVRSVLTERSTQEGERIARGALNWSIGDAHSIEAGLETAFNFRETASNLSVGVDSTRVEELRGEAFISDVWLISPALTLETGLNFEASRISQSGDAQNEREFTYPKPRIIATYQLPNEDQLRFSVERDVDQLDFGAFSSSISASENTQNDGNPNLEPEQTWRYRLNWERRFAARGSISVEAFLDQVEGVEEFAVLRNPDGSFRVRRDEDGDPILNSSGNVIFIQGDDNIGDGERRGVSVDASVPFAFLGAPNAVLDLGATVQESEILDPFTMETRSFQGFEDWRYNVGFRHDVTDWDISYGGRYQREDDSQSFRVDRVFNNSNDVGQLNLFVETTRLAGVTVRLNVDNVLDQTRTREQIDFNVDRRTPDDIDEIELRDARGGRTFGLRVSGTF